VVLVYLFVTVSALALISVQWICSLVFDSVRGYLCKIRLEKRLPPRSHFAIAVRTAGRGYPNPQVTSFLLFFVYLSAPRFRRDSFGQAGGGGATGGGGGDSGPSQF
jgi:hypothetical protein